MASKAQRRATKSHRLRLAAHGLVRVEVQAARRDVPLLRAVAATLRDDSETAKALRSSLTKAVGHRDIRTAFDVFGADLPDEAFAGVFEQPRRQKWRKVDL